MQESAVLIAVAEAEPLVGHWRERFDGSAADGVPAHVTLIYPFIAVEWLNRTVIDAIREEFAPVAPFDFALVAPARFPGVLYLQPEPEAPFRALVGALVSRYPDHPPYGGEFDDAIRHLTVAQSEDEDVLSWISSELESGLPIRAHASEA